MVCYTAVLSVVTQRPSLRTAVYQTRPYKGREVWGSQPCSSYTQHSTLITSSAYGRSKIKDVINCKLKH